MSLNNPPRGRATIAVTFGVALLLSIVPWPVWAEPIRPDWVALALIYWCMALPERVGVGVGFSVGLILDVLYGSLLGQQALAKTVLAFIVLKLHLQLRMFPLWQQAVTVMILVAVNQLLVVWVKGLTGHSPGTIAYWMPSIVSMLLWPWVFTALRWIRRNARVT